MIQLELKKIIYPASYENPLVKSTQLLQFTLSHPVPIIYFKLIPRRKSRTYAGSYERHCTAPVVNKEQCQY